MRARLVGKKSRLANQQVLQADHFSNSKLLPLPTSLKSNLETQKSSHSSAALISSSIFGNKFWILMLGISLLSLCSKASCHSGTTLEPAARTLNVSMYMFVRTYNEQYDCCVHCILSSHIDPFTNLSIGAHAVRKYLAVAWVHKHKAEG